MKRSKNSRDVQSPTPQFEHRNICTYNTNCTRYIIDCYTKNVSSIL